MQIGNGMVMEPDLKEVHKDLSTGCVGFEELIGLSFPLFLKFVGDFFHENGVLVESILIFLILKKGKIGVIKYMVLFFMKSSLVSWVGKDLPLPVFCSSYIFEDFVFNIVLQWRNFKITNIAHYFHFFI